MSDASRPLPHNTDSEHDAVLARALQEHVPCLKEVSLAGGKTTADQAAVALAQLTQLLTRIEQTLLSQLEVMGRNNARIKTMAETLRSQGLLDVQGALQAVLDSKSERMTRLVKYGELFMRWWSAVLTGVQTTVPEFPHELEQALNPANWQVEKKRLSSEEEAFWNHFKFVIRHELPLRLGDRMKGMQADKTLDAYAILGSGKRAEAAPEDM